MHKWGLLLEIWGLFVRTIQWIQQFLLSAHKATIIFSATDKLFLWLSSQFTYVPSQTNATIANIIIQMWLNSGAILMN